MCEEESGAVAVEGIPKPATSNLDTSRDSLREVACRFLKRITRRREGIEGIEGFWLRRANAELFVLRPASETSGTGGPTPIWRS